MCGTTCFTFLLRVGDPFFFQSEILTTHPQDHEKLWKTYLSLFFFTLLLRRRPRRRHKSYPTPTNHQNEQ